MIGPGSAHASFTNRLPVSASCSPALATADRTTLSTSTAARFFENFNSASASSTSRPRIKSRTSRAFRGEILAYRCIALKAIVHLPQSNAIRDPFSLRRRSSRSGARYRRLLSAMPLENPRRRELPQLVSHHVLLHKHLDELVPVVNLKRMAHKLRNDRASPTPGLQRLLRPPLIERGHALEQLLIHIRTL